MEVVDTATVLLQLGETTVEEVASAVAMETADLPSETTSEMTVNKKAKK